MVAARRGTGNAIVSTDHTWSFDELAARVWGAAAALSALPEDGAAWRPALFATTAPAYAWVLGGAAAGRPLAPLGTRLTVRELEACVRASGASTVLADRAHELLASDVAAAAGAAVVVLEEPPSGPPPVQSPDGSDVAFVVHTSGTSGLPKPVAYRQDRAAVRAGLLASLFALEDGSVYATSSAFHHVAGFAGGIAALAAGTAVVPVERFSTDCWGSLGSFGVTHALLVPTMIDVLLEAGLVAAIPSLRVLTYGAAPMHPRTLAATLAAVPEVDLVQLFGQTEGTPLTVLTAGDHRAALGRPELLTSVGRAVDGVELRVVPTGDADGPGEVWARGPHLAGADDGDGWLHTGDLGTLDDEGYLRLAGRLGDRIVRGGENVDPLEVEEILAAHAAVREAAVRGVTDERWGQVVAAWVVPVDVAAPPDLDELRRHARAALAGFKVPTLWAFVEHLPRNVVGKVLRRELELDRLASP
jgi:acyl-CoA synthetase (AMP-forming)/AMP-acid ligase II